MKRLSSPISSLAARYDAIVIGSGYGGAVAASRLSRMGKKVAVLERGEEIQPGEFPDTPDKALAQSQIQSPLGRVGPRTGLYDLRVNPDINVLVGCGLGGTSLINANVSLRPDPRLFEDPAWPPGLVDGDLEAGFARAETMLKPRPYPGDAGGFPPLNKLAALEKAAAALGTSASRPPLNVSFEQGYNPAGIWQPACNVCGDCCSGCNTGAKSTTAMNYLPDAVAFGAEIYCAIRALWVQPGDGGWAVAFEPQGLGREVFDAAQPMLLAPLVVIAAGTLGSTEILLRSREKGLSLSTRLGSRFTGNGDVLAFSYNDDAPVDGIGLGYRAAGYDWKTDSTRPVGPTISGVIDLRGGRPVEEGMVIEEGAIPGGLAPFLPAMMAACAAKFGADSDRGDRSSEKAREIESLIHGPYRGAVNHTQTFLVMSHDGSDGTLSLEDGRLAVQWPGVGDKPVFATVADRLRTAAGATGGTYVPNPVWTALLDHHLVTVHPLGGCPMAGDSGAGAVDSDCRVFSGQSGTSVHEGLLVCDGAVMPRSLGVNPLLTITAVAERAMIRLAARERLGIDLSPAGPQPRQDDGPRPTGIRFTEKMAGTVAGGGGPEGPASFVVTVIAGDVERFLAEPDHEAELVGTVHVPALSPQPLTVVDGRFNLFTSKLDQVETRQMEYRMPLVAADGRRFHFHGRKLIHDDKGFDLWRDTTSLAAAISEGTDGNGQVLLEGTLTIAPADFIRQLRTMTATDAPDLKTRLGAVMKFGCFFAGELFLAFGGPFARPSLFDPDKPRVRRPLRAGTPEVHYFDSSDGKRLRFSRYRGGHKGPVLLSHGLGVSSLIFAIDTIETNLLEYLYADGYDCWLLDYRASIELEHVRDQFTADMVAERDYPAAVDFVRVATGRPSVQMVAHCYGAMSFAMAMLGGLQGVRSAVISQIAAHADVPFFPQRLLAWLRAPDLMKAMGVELLDARATGQRDRLSKAIDDAIAFAYPFRADNRSRSVTSRRITALYGPLYELGQLNQATLDAMPEMFGKANISAFRHLSRIARAGHVVRPDGSGDYLADSRLRKFAIPTLFVHGALNRTFMPSGTAKTMEALARVNGPGFYERVVIPGSGHLDTIFGKNAASLVYPHIVRHLAATAHS